MFKIVILLALLFVPPLNAFSAEIVEVQLLELQEYYSINGTLKRYADFQLDRAPTTVYNVQIRIVGTINIGQYTCALGPGLSEGPFPYAIEFVAGMKDTISGSWWMADQLSPEETGTFNLTIPFQQVYGSPASLDFLKSGRGTVEFLAMPAGLYGMCWALIWPDATVNEVLLIIEADFGVAVEQSTWGSIKSLYR